MATKISALPAASAVNITDVAVGVPFVDATTTTTRATIAQLRTQLSVGGFVTTGAGNLVGLTLQGVAGQNRDVLWQSGTSSRWMVRVTSTAEGGGNAGSDFVILSFTDAGAVNDTPLTIPRVLGGTVLLTRPLSVSGLLTIPSTVTSAAGGGTDIVFGATTQTTIGANGAASALTANPLGYLVFYKGATKCVLPYYNG